VITTKKDIRVAETYKDAIFQALKLNAIEKPALDSVFHDILDGYRHHDMSLFPVNLASKKQWQIKTPKYSNQAVVINNHILHSHSTGFLRSRQILNIDKMRYQCHSDLPQGSTLQYIVINAEQFKAGSRTARFEYMQSLRRWYAQFPFKIYIVYNANIFMKTALALAKHLMPFKIKIAKNLKHAIQIVHDDKPDQLTEEANSLKKSGAADVDQNDIENLLSLIGNLNWEIEGVDKEANVAQSHPFFYIYEALKLIKEELDDLFNQRKTLEGQLHQSQKMESIGRLAGGVAHDFNNILQMIMGNTELAMDDVPSGSELHKNLKEIKHASLKGAGIVGQLLNFSRKAEPQFRPVDATRVTHDAIVFLRSTIPANIKILEDLTDEYITIFADPVQINQVLMNICINAAYEMEQTGGNIHIRTSVEDLGSDHVKYLSELKQGEYYKIVVQDTGPGISEGIIDKIFDPYFTTKEMGKGSGMGLSVVHGIVKNHKGIVLVDSQLGAGTSFTILIPQIDDIPVEDFKFAEKQQWGKESILFVDDEKTINYLTKKGMEKFGYKVTTCLNPEQAIDMFQSNPNAYDIVITDMAMPQMTGIKLFDQLKLIRQDIPIIICTGYSNLIDEKESKKMGFSAYVMKPFSMEDLSAVIRSILD